MKEHIPIFLASDDRYIPPLSVTLISLDKNSSDRYIYDVYILNGGLSAESMRTLSSHTDGNYGRFRSLRGDIHHLADKARTPGRRREN